MTEADDAAKRLAIARRWQDAWARARRIYAWRCTESLLAGDQELANRCALLFERCGERCLTAQTRYSRLNDEATDRDFARSLDVNLFDVYSAGRVKR